MIKRGFRRKLKLMLEILAVIAVVLYLIPIDLSGDHVLVKKSFTGTVEGRGLCNIGVIRMTTHDGINGYSSGASGVIINQADDRYYALVCYHEIDEDARYLILTQQDDTLAEYRGKHPEVGHVYVDDYYDSLPAARIEAVCKELDCAIISFVSKKDLDAAKVSYDSVEKGTSVLGIGNRDGEFFCESYGRIKSSHGCMFRTEEEDGLLYETEVFKSSFKSYPGYSGGGVFDEDDRLIGITIGGATNLIGKCQYSAVVTCTQMKEFLSNSMQE